MRIFVRLAVFQTNGISPTLRSKVSEVLIRYNFSFEDAQFLADLLQEIDDRQRSEFEQKLDLLLTQKDKTELTMLMQQDKTELIDRMQQDKTELIDRMQQGTVELTERMQQSEVQFTERMQQLEGRLTERMQKDKAELTLRLQQTTVDLTNQITQVESRLVKQVYIVGLIQFLAIVGALIGIINFALS